VKQQNSYLEDCLASAINNALDTGRKQEHYYDTLLEKYKEQEERLNMDLEEERNKVREGKEKIAILEVKITTLSNQINAQHIKVFNNTIQHRT
jgi:predicted  nucleic acid-binding Zn-ribbon protein